MLLLCRKINNLDLYKLFHNCTNPFKTALIVNDCTPRKRRRLNLLLRIVLRCGNEADVLGGRCPGRLGGGSECPTLAVSPYLGPRMSIDGRSCYRWRRRRPPRNDWCCSDRSECVDCRGKYETVAALRIRNSTLEYLPTTCNCLASPPPCLCHGLVYIPC